MPSCLRSNRYQLRNPCIRDSKQRSSSCTSPPVCAKYSCFAFTMSSTLGATYASSRSNSGWIISLALDHLHEPAEQVPRVVRTRAVLGVVLHREHARFRHGDPFDRAIVQVSVRDPCFSAEARLVCGKAVVLARHVDAVPQQVAHRMVCPAVPELELVRPATHRQRQDLVAQADTQNRHLAEKL